MTGGVPGHTIASDGLHDHSCGFGPLYAMALFNLTTNCPNLDYITMCQQDSAQETKIYMPNHPCV